MKEEQQGHKIFVEQAMHEMHRGAFDLAVYYLRRAIRVSKYQSFIKNKSTTYAGGNDIMYLVSFLVMILNSQLNPNDHVTHVERAACYLGLAQYEKALADANEALALGIMF